MEETDDDLSQLPVQKLLSGGMSAFVQYCSVSMLGKLAFPEQLFQQQIYAERYTLMASMTVIFCATDC